MSQSDETPGDEFAEGVTPESTPESTPEPTPESGAADETWSEADSAAVEAEVEAEEGGQEAGGMKEGINGGVVEPELFALDPMQQLESERDEYLLALQRTQADFENYRKRIQRMQDEQSARAASDLVNKLLPVLDTLDLAQAHQSEAGADSEDAKALAASRAMLLDALAKEGLERVDEAGVKFDPSVHDAVARVEGEGGEEVVDQVLRSGYRFRGKVLRPAMVSVRG
ncbi:MAG TPA: nucleotide exchange factor GrpE [Acidimicrobiales bacterium]